MRRSNASNKHNAPSRLDWTRLSLAICPPDTVSLGARPMAVEVSALPQDQPAIQSAASEIASDVLFRRELNAEFRRLERARQQSQTLRDGLQAQLEKLQRMAQA